MMEVFGNAQVAHLAIGTNNRNPHIYNKEVCLRHTLFVKVIISLNKLAVPLSNEGW